ncbi:MAG TPA: OB-fold-containig protein [Fimbriimonas sp.]
MLRFFLADENFPFAIGIGLALALSLLQFIGLMGDASADADTDVDVDGDFDLHDALRWIGVGVVPTTALIMFLSLLFGVAGYLIQSVAFSLTGGLLPSVPVSIVALLASLPPLSAVSRLARRFLFREETTAVHGDSLVGSAAVLTLGTAQRGRPAQAKLKDRHGQTHYVLVEPYREDDRFDQGAEVVLVQREGARFFAVPNTVEGLESFERAPEIPAENHAKQSSR